MMLKTGQALASGQAKAIAGGAPARLRPCANRKHAAFKGGRAGVRAAAAEPEASEPAPTAAPKARRAKREVTVDLATVSPGDEFEGTVTAVEGYGAFVDFGAEKNGLVHISQLSNKFLKNVGDAVAAGDAVKVRVLSVDAAAGKIALTMKSESAAEDGELERDDAAEGGELLPADGHEFVYADAVADFEYPFQMREDAAMTIADVNEFEDAELEAEPTVDLPLPLNELVKGTVTRVEDFGAFMTVSAGGRELKAFLERDEAKVPSAGLSAEQLAGYGVRAGDVVPEYLDAEMDSMKEAYKVGDVVTAFVLDFTDRGELNVTQYTDAEVEADGFDIEEEDNEEDDEEPLSVMGTEGYDVLAMEPEDLLDEEDDKSRGPVGDDGDELSAAAQDYKVFGRSTPLSGSLYSKSGMTMPAVSFPDRPLDKIDANAINNLSNVDTDFDGDEIYLDELWQESIPVPRSALRKLGLKAEISEDGQVEIVEREGAEVVDEDVLVALHGDIDVRAAAFVEDLMEDDEDEAEVPAYAMRRPLVLAAAVGEISAKMVKALRQKTGAGMMDCKKALGECAGDETAAIDWLRKKGLSGADKKAGRVAAEGAIVQYIHPGARLGVLLEVNCETDFVAASEKFQGLVNELGMIIAASPDVQVVGEEDVSADMLAKEREVQMGLEELKSKPEAIRAKIVEGRLDKIKKAMALMNQDSLRDTTKTVGEIVKETIAATGENVQIRRFVKYQLGEGIEKKSNDFAAEVAEQTQAKAKASEPKAEDPKKKEEAKKEEAAVATVAVSAKTVKELRGATGAGMMDCKKALACNNNDLTAATEWLRKKGLSGADKKAGRIAAEGAIISYIHPGSRLGVMMEINCETDFVAAGDQFNQLANGIAMQIAASPDVQYVSAEDIPAEVFEREKEIEMQREDLKAKPEAIRAKIAEGRVAKLAQTMALLPQPFLMDDSKTIEQAVKEAIASIGEKISIRRFVTFRLGEGIEKKQMDLAADVAAMTGGKV